MKGVGVNERVMIIVEVQVDEEDVVAVLQEVLLKFGLCLLQQTFAFGAELC